MDIKKINKYIEMIDEYVEEPNSIDKQWLNFMYDMRAILRKDLCSTTTADNAMDNIRVVLDYGAKMPSKAYDTDAGFDLYSRDDTFSSNSSAIEFILACSSIFKL